MHKICTVYCKIVPLSAKTISWIAPNIFLVHEIFHLDAKIVEPILPSLLWSVNREDKVKRFSRRNKYRIESVRPSSY